MGSSYSVFLIAAGSIVLGACSCDDSANVNDAGLTDANVADADAAVVVQPDASPDAGDGGQVFYDFCALPMFQLPVDASDRHRGVSLWGDRVVFGRTIRSPTLIPSQLYLLDLVTCMEERLTEGRTVEQVTSWDRSVFWTDNHTCGESCREIFYLDLEQGTPTQLTSQTYGTFVPYGNDDYVVFTRLTELLDLGQQDLVLLDLATSQERILAPADAHPTYHAVSERYVAWTAASGDPQSQGRDVYYHDLVTGVTTHIDETAAGYQYAVTVDGDHLSWFGSDLYLQDPYHLVLHHIPTGDSTVLVDNDGAVRWGRIHRNLVAYNTTRYTGNQIQLPADIEIYDIDTGLRRRVTQSSGGLISMGLFFPRLMVVNYVSSITDSNPYYFIDLVKYGITDETGHLLPGDGVVVVPQ